MSKTTIKDVAKTSGFSTATVSLALSGKPSRISENTKKKIITVAKDLHYLPSQVAVSLKTKRSKMLGLVMADISNPHVSTVFVGIDTEVRKHGYVLICCTTDRDGMISPERMESLIACGIDGLIFSVPSLNEESYEWKALEKTISQSGVPIVSRDNNTFYRKGIGSTLDVNYEEGGYLATRHLLELGHNKIGCVTGIDGMYVTEYRLNGYFRALREFGIEEDHKLVYHGDYEMDSGSSALPYLLGQGVTAVFAFNDNMAFGIYKSARTFGIRIPDNLSLVGFDNVAFDEVLEVPLTSIHFHANEIGTGFAQEIIRLIENKEEKPKRILFEPCLMIRGSTKKV
ncbi:MAG: LacI family DNA-binding transcriptional regulator [Flexilinea sp.]